METTYCTVSDVTTYAAANGESSWSVLVNNDLSGAVNLVAGYAAGLRTMLVDGIDDGINPLAPGDTFTIATDSTATVYTISATVFGTVTTSLTFFPGLAEAVADNDGITITQNRSSAQQTRCVVVATQDILEFTGLIYPDGSLFQPTNTDMVKAASIQAIHLNKIFGKRDSATQIRELFKGQFNDGVISGSANEATLHPTAKWYVNKVLSEYCTEVESIRDMYKSRPYYGR